MEDLQYFKTEKKLSDCELTEVVYISENAEDISDIYTKQMFISKCYNLPLFAQHILDMLTWEYPTTYLEEIDLFEYYEFLPKEVNDVLDKYSSGDNDYDTCEQLIKALELIGYTCEYDLSGEPYGLRPIK
jgi:hypothetical protein